MSKKLAWPASALVVLFAGIQFIGPAPPQAVSYRAEAIQASGKLTPEVTAVLRRACADCHSDATRWPWYSRVAPISWLLVRDVREGRRKLNFSQWARTQGPSQNEMEEICDEVQRGSMPPLLYSLVNWRAKPSSDDVSRICGWLDEIKTTGSRTNGARR
jgi:hypothetical protein